MLIELSSAPTDLAAEWQLTVKAGSASWAAHERVPADPLTVRMDIDHVRFEFLVSPAGFGHGHPAGATMLEHLRTEDGTTIRICLTSSALLDRLKNLHPSEGGLIDLTAQFHDETAERLARTLIRMEEAQGEWDALFVEAASLALVARVVGLRQESADGGRRKLWPLPKWRLKRALEFIDANLSEPVGAEDLAQSAGLTRMHFAAQFRLATGLRPHEFLLRRRIERAQDMMRNSEDSLVEIALNVGFQTQAHFTTVFKRFVGETPYRWRRQDAADLCRRRFAA
ncbi:AraC-like DNA-binding protein [Rhodoligotrophos appendicifer]|uniref:AraC family transcriptional regulator n=1 Tax=Rhodoligotrophos appendicifer TaxID=987056 RepID=UPI001FE8BD0D|nr:AraC family transcriptional regulator [Rhodoligotrophos appendicifer]